MKIEQMKLENFQGIRELTLDFGGKNAAIYGDNGTGKTTVYNAFTWILFDKPSTGEKNFTPQTTGTHNLSHSVLLKISEDGKPGTTLKKTMHETYKSIKGSTEKTFTGHTTEYELNGVPVQEKEFQKEIQSITGGSEMVRMLADPNYFLEEMSVTDRRKILVDVCGYTTIDEILAKHPDLKDLPTILQRDDGGTYTVDEYMTVAKKQSATIQATQNELPIRIDEAEKAKPAASEESNEELTGETARIQARISAENAALENLAPVSRSELVKQKAEAEADLAKARRNFMDMQYEKRRGVLENVEALRSNLGHIIHAKGEQEAAVTSLTLEMNRMEKRRESLIDEFKRIKQQEWSGQTICPTCGQPIPEEKIDASKQSFRANKAQRLEEIQDEGRKNASVEMITEKQNKINDANELIKKYYKMIEGLDGEIKDAESKVPEEEDFSATEACRSIHERIDKIESLQMDAATAEVEAAKPHKDEIARLTEELRTIQEKQACRKMIEIQNRKIAEYRTEEETKAAEYEKIQKGIWVCQKYMMAQAEELTSKINGHFKTLQFRLFIEQVNGGLKDDCEALVPNEYGRMVPFKSANNAARINAGMEVINTLSRNYGIQIPIFVDNAESVTKLEKPDTQTIRLIVSENDKQLRMEHED